MHFFDPTLDWPKELLDEQMPDLIVIRSRSLKNPSAPWNEADDSWRTTWMQYAAPEGNDCFVNMTFLDGAPANEFDRREVGAYLQSIAQNELSIHKYRSLSFESNLPVLANTPIIKCRPDNVTTVDSDPALWSLKYELIGGTGAGTTGKEVWQHLVVEPKTDDTMPNGFSGENQAVYPTPPKNDQSKMPQFDYSTVEDDEITLYVVAASPKLQHDELSANQFNFVTEMDFLSGG